MSRPWNSMRPASGRSWPLTRLKRVVFPAPLGPRIPRVSPSATAKEIPSVTRRAPKLFETARRVRIVAIDRARPRAEPQLSGRAARGRAPVVHADDLVTVLLAGAPLP